MRLVNCAATGCLPLSVRAAVDARIRCRHDDSRARKRTQICVCNFGNCRRGSWSPAVRQVPCPGADPARAAGADGPAARLLPRARRCGAVGGRQDCALRSGRADRCLRLVLSLRLDGRIRIGGAVRARTRADGPTVRKCRITALRNCLRVTRRPGAIFGVASSIVTRPTSDTQNVNGVSREEISHGESTGRICCGGCGDRCGRVSDYVFPSMSRRLLWAAANSENTSAGLRSR